MSCLPSVAAVAALPPTLTYRAAPPSHTHQTKQTNGRWQRLEWRHARLRWPLLPLWQHRREGPPPKHGLQGARAAQPTLLPQDRPWLRQGASRFLPRRDLCQAQQLQPAAPRRTRRSAAASRPPLFSICAASRAKSRAAALTARHGLLAQVLALFYVPPWSMQSASLSLCCARREPRHSLSPGNPVCARLARA